MTESAPPTLAAVELRFRSGTLEIAGVPPEFVGLPAACVWDERTNCLRAPASAYAEVVHALRRLKIAYLDQARHYETLAAGAVVRREPRPYQSEALEAWKAAGGRGVVVLPTGAGKTLVAQMAIDLRRRCTKCKSQLRLIALIKTEDLAKKILKAMHLPSDARACPPTPCTAGLQCPELGRADSRPVRCPWRPCRRRAVLAYKRSFGIGPAKLEMA